MKRISYALCGGLLVAAAGSVQAAIYEFDCITGNSPGDCAIGEDQLSVAVSSSAPEAVTFSFYNTGSAASSVEGIYFDDGTLLGISSLAESAGVEFTGGSASPPNLPGANGISPSFQTTAGFLADSDPPPSHNGINPGEWLDITFDLQSNFVLADVLDDLATGDLRIGLHVIAYDSGGSESFVNDPVVVPIPAAGLFYGSALLGLAALRRRRG